MPSARLSCQEATHASARLKGSGGSCKRHCKGPKCSRQNWGGQGVQRRRASQKADKNSRGNGSGGGYRAVLSRAQMRRSE